MQTTARTLADQVVAARQSDWELDDPAIGIAATEKLNPDDETVVDGMVEAAGFTGAERANMIRKVKSLIVGQVEAQLDNSPADCG